MFFLVSGFRYSHCPMLANSNGVGHNSTHLQRTENSSRQEVIYDNLSKLDYYISTKLLSPRQSMGVNLRGTLRVIGKQDSLFPMGLVYPRELMSFEP